MFLSMVAAPNVRIGALTKEADKRRFNVAASRARDQVWLFHSVQLPELSSSCLRHALLNYYLNPTLAQVGPDNTSLEELRVLARKSNRHRNKTPRPFESWFELDVFLEIANRGYRVIPQFRVSNYRIDFVVKGSSAQLAVECDGDEFHGPENYEKDIARERTLRRCGWKFWRVRGSEFYLDPDKALLSLWDELELRGITPTAASFGKQTYVDGYVPKVDFSIDSRAETEGVVQPATMERTMAVGRKVTPTPRHVTESSADSKASENASTNESETKPVGNIDLRPEVWFAMANWAKENSALSPMDRSTLVNVGSKLRQNEAIDNRLAARASDLYHELIKKGFAHPLLKDE